MTNPVRVITVTPHTELITARDNIHWASHALRLIEECGRVSHKSEGRRGPDTAAPFVRKIAIRMGHESILEHASFTTCFVLSRSGSHQLVRHRLAAYTQESQRYCDYSDENKHPGLRIIVPHMEGGRTFEWNEQHQCLKEHEGPALTRTQRRYVVNALRCYADYLDQRTDGEPAEDARECLPNSTKTEVYATFNLRVWRHLFRMRLDQHAQHQIKRCVREVYEHFALTCPLLLEGLQTHSGEPLAPLSPEMRVVEEAVQSMKDEA